MKFDRDLRRSSGLLVQNHAQAEPHLTTIIFRQLLTISNIWDSTSLCSLLFVCNLHIKEVLPDVHMEPPVFQFLSCTSTDYHWKDPASDFFAVSFQIFIKIAELCLVFSCLFLTGKASTGSSAPGMASPVLSKEEGLLSSTCWQLNAQHRTALSLFASRALCSLMFNLGSTSTPRTYYPKATFKLGGNIDSSSSLGARFFNSPCWTSQGSCQSASHPSFVPFANLLRIHSVPLFILLIKILNRITPSIDSWGILLVSYFQLDFESLVTTLS